jgi:hypothetical protein
MMVVYVDSIDISTLHVEIMIKNRHIRLEPYYWRKTLTGHPLELILKNKNIRTESTPLSNKDQFSLFMRNIPRNLC